MHSSPPPPYPHTHTHTQHIHVQNIRCLVLWREGGPEIAGVLSWHKRLKFTSTKVLVVLNMLGKGSLELQVCYNGTKVLNLRVQKYLS
jgi:hypothetical protein